MLESISHGISKWKRNLAARDGKTDFDKHLIKATFDGDEKEPKAKHVIYMLDCFKNKVPEKRPKDAFSDLFQKFLDNLGSWVHTTKVYSIFHAALQDPATLRDIANELKERENLLYCYAKHPEEREYIETKHYEISQIYSTFIKKLSIFITGCPILGMTHIKQAESIKATTPMDRFWIYTQAKELVQIIIGKMFTNTMFCCKYRIYKNVLKLMYIDLVRLYRVCYCCITETISNLEKLSLEEIRKANESCQDFIKLTEDAKIQVGAMLSQLKDSIPVAITYFNATPDLLKNLKDFLAAKEEVSRLEETGGAPGYAPAAPGNEEEYNLEDNPEGNGNANANAEKQGEDEDYNIGEGGLDEFMTSLKQERKSEAPAPYATVVKRAPEEAKARKTAAPRPVPVASRAVENDNEIMGFAQGGAPPAKPKQKADEFEQLFGDIPAEQRAPAAQVTRPPDTRKPAPPSSSYDQFAAYYTTYQQPVAKPPASSYQPSNPAGYGQQSPAQAGPNAFDDVASKYSRPNPGADGAGEFWQ